ncbi:hypothetical protein K438DRAFT_602331 [Mycena galopus ATCC 62051]|nr:hypothetical protein K438DRAFT_602331 [Mycena galopus ATCC 62051]
MPLSSRLEFLDTTASLPQLKRASRGSPESRTHPFSLSPAVFLRSHTSCPTPLLTPSANINTSPGPRHRLRRPPSYSPLDEAVHCRGTVQARRSRPSRHGVKGWVVLVRVPSARAVFLERARGPRRWRTYRHRCGDASLSPQIVPLHPLHTRRRRGQRTFRDGEGEGDDVDVDGCIAVRCYYRLQWRAAAQIWMAHLTWSTSISIASPAPLRRYRCMGIHIAPYRFGGHLRTSRAYGGCILSSTRRRMLRLSRLSRPSIVGTLAAGPRSSGSSLSTPLDATVVAQRNRRPSSFVLQMGGR